MQGYIRYVMMLKFKIEKITTEAAWKNINVYGLGFIKQDFIISF